MVWGLIDCGRRRTGGEAGSDKTDLVGAGRVFPGTAY